MNHEQICAMWVAHNLGASQVVVPQAHHRRNSTEITMRVKPEARAANIRYEGDTIYSWHWWPMARFVPAVGSDRVVLYRDERYSVSTSQHQSEVRSALDRVPHVQVFRTYGEPCLDHEANMNAYVDKATEFFQKAFRARRQAAYWLARAEAEYDQLRGYAQAFGVSEPVWANPFENDPKKIAAFEARLTELSIRTGTCINPFWRKVRLLRAEALQAAAAAKEYFGTRTKQGEPNA